MSLGLFFFFPLGSLRGLGSGGIVFSGEAVPADSEHFLKHSGAVD